MTWEAAAAALVAYVGQHVKAIKGIPTWAPQDAMLIAGIGLYALQKPPGGNPLNEWFMEAVMFGFAIVGVASRLGTSGLAPATDSKAVVTPPPK